MAALTDALSSQRFERIVTTPALHDDYVRRQVGRVGYLGLVYSFGGQKKAKPAGFEYES